MSVRSLRREPGGIARAGAGPRGASWVADLTLGARLAVRGGRSGALRLALTSFAVSLCIVVLLLAASVGPALDARGARETSRQPTPVLAFDEQTGREVARPALLEVHASVTPIDGRPLSGVDLAALVPSAPAPPGVSRLPGPGELVLSPALADLLASDAGAAIRPWVSGSVIGSIDRTGLVADDELFFYRGITPSATADPYDQAAGWGVQASAPDAPDVFLDVLLTAGTTIVLVPLLIFVSLMSRIGASARDRRSAAIRLLGASAAQLRRITLTESLLATAAGLLAGALGYLAVRQAAPSLEIGSAGFYPADIAPTPVAAGLVALLAPVLTIGAVWFGGRRTIVEPLGVVRAARPAPRRLLWRLAVAAFGVLSMIAAVSLASVAGDQAHAVVLSVSIIAVLVSVPVLLPWCLERLAGRLPARGVAWQLAVRRLQLDPGTPARVVAGVSVMLAGAIALQALLGLGGGPEPEAPASERAPVVNVLVQGVTLAELDELPERIRQRTGLAASGGIPLSGSVGQTGEYVDAVVAPCALLPEVADCVDGAVYQTRFDVNRADATEIPDLAANVVPPLEPGATLRLERYGAAPVAWTVPSSIVPVEAVAITRPSGSGLVITPGALGADLVPLVTGGDLVMTVPDDGRPGLANELRTALAYFGWRADVRSPGEEGVSVLAGREGTITTGLYLGSGLTLLVAALGLLVTAIEQLTERRRALTLTVATGVPRAVLARSLMIGAALPVLVGTVLSVAAGLALAWFLGTLLDEPFEPDVGLILLFSGAAILVILLVTAATLPALRRLTRPESLRTE